MAPPRSPISDFELSGFFALRTPLLPLNDFLSWSSDLEAASALANPETLEAALARDRRRLRARLETAIERPEVREALFVASPSLDESLKIWREDPDSERGLKVERTLVRYFARMSGRSTPFGLFAGTSVGRLEASEGAPLRLAPRSEYERHTRLDMDYVSALTDALQGDPALTRALVHRPNSSLYRHADRWRYVEGRLIDRARRYQLTSVETTPYLESVLERAREGARLDELAQLLVTADPEITPDQATEYVQALAEAQVLVSDLSLAVTGAEPIHHLLAQLASLPVAPVVSRTLVQVRDALAQMDTEHLGVPSHRYREVAQWLEPLPTPAELPRLFQVDMTKPLTSGTLGRHVQKALGEAIAALHALTRPKPRPLARFKEEFLERYEQREVPFVEVLDEESGIGFENPSDIDTESSPLLQGLLFPARSEAGSVAVTARDRMLLAKVLRARESGSREIAFTSAELDAVRDPTVLDLPEAFAAMGAVLATSPEAVAAGKLRVVLESVNGPSGANLLGRFCHGDPALAEAVTSHVRAEEALHRDRVYAEIVHLPEGRVGNVLSRPVLRAHEIPYLGRASVDRDHQIPVSDLLLSVRGGRVVLRSVRLGREVAPRNSTSHNFPRGLRTYRFLCYLASQDVQTPVTFDWGPLASAPFLPRVVAGKAILSPATWRVEAEELAAWGQAQGAALFRRLQTFRGEVGLPRHVLLKDGDNQLPVDFDNVLSLESLVSLVRTRREAVLVEQLFTPDQLLVEGPEGRFLHELIVPAVRRPSEASVETPVEPPLPPKGDPSRRRRRFPPGSEWLYLKVYMGTASADRVLAAARPVVETALQSSDADRFFFIRMADPRWHIRFRFHGAPDRLLRAVLPAFHAAMEPLLESGIVWRVGLDTYEREEERYGGSAGMQLAEELFQIDSRAVLELLPLLDGEDAAEARVQLCFRGVDTLLDDLGLDLAAKAKLMTRMRRSYGTEFRVEGAFERQLGDRFRARRKRLEAILTPTPKPDDPFAPGFEIWARRSVELRSLAQRLRLAQSQGQLTRSIEELAPSYVHMHSNRMLRAAARAQELVLYDFLVRSYDSQLARLRGPPAR